MTHHPQLPAEHQLSDEQWRAIANRLPEKLRVRAANNEREYRSFVGAVLWLCHTDMAWAYLPAAYGHRRAIYIRFLRWCQADIWSRVIDALQSNQHLAEALRDRVQRYEDGVRRMERQRALRAELLDQDGKDDMMESHGSGRYPLMA